jgi:hypothetical protein
MTAAKALLERFGFLTSTDLDHFDLRLARIGRREQRHSGMAVLFKNRLNQPAT